MTTLLATWKAPGRVAIESAWRRREAGGGLLDCLEAGLAAAELDPNLVLVGLGSIPNSDGELELDASIMDGADLSAGAVCAVRGIVPVISVARKVMETTEHVMIAGDQARRFAIECGFEPNNLMTADSIRLHQQWRSDPERGKAVHALAEVADTVTMLGASDGHLVAASSTSGRAHKLPGRVGDSPIVGAGIYADNELAAVGATGLGEALWKSVASYRTAAAVGRGATAQAACEETIRDMMRRQPRSRELPCVVFALDRAGNIGAACSKGDFELWICRDGEITMETFAQLDG